jgi:lipopolysaccharide/colanic/teichoic acid biosynthesis glycosyltransferase
MRSAVAERKVSAARSSAARIRLFDLGVTILLLPFALVAGIAIAAIIFVDSPGPIFYRSRRVGRGGAEFDMLKFRKMRRDATGGPLTRLRDDRLTPIGEFLVATKLDELPQLWNVLRGQMSLVGPRPEVREFVTMYAAEYREILSVVPGITGPAQLEYIEERHLLADAHESHRLYAEEILPRKIAVDLQYIRRQSLRNDLRIIARTALAPVHTLRDRLAARRSRVDRRRLVSYGGAVLAVAALLVAFILAAGPIR